MTHAQLVTELDDAARFEPNKRSNRCVGPFLTEERALELAIRAVECLVVPVETTASLGDVREQRKENRAEESVLGADACVCPGEDCGGRFAPECIECNRGVGN